MTVDLEPLSRIIARHAPAGRAALLPVLIDAHEHYCYLPEEVTAAVAQGLGVPLADVHGVIDYYAMLRREPSGCTTIRVCTDPPCALRGGDAVLDAVSRTLDETGLRGAFEVERAPCHGLCAHAPAVLVDDVAIAGGDRVAPIDLVRGIGPQPRTHVAGHPRILTANCGVVDPASLADYESHGGMTALRTAVTTMSPVDVVSEVTAAGLVGRGGAAFPAGTKWSAVAGEQRGPKYVVCNADESEPGTFKDRVLMEGDPFRVLEGTVLAGYAVGAARGYVYVRGEYAAARRSLEEAAQAMRAAGLLGEAILGSAFSFDVEVRSGAGAYLCGEETALFESIEGKRGFPRVKPPFPTSHGLFGRPTVANNVETLCNVPTIVAGGATAYRALGTAQSSGTKLFCLSGDVALPGLYEAPFGITLRHLLYDLAGGIPGGRAVRAVLLGGAAGAFAVPDQLDVRLSFEHLKEAGLPLGSGVVMVFDETRDLRDVLRRLTRFFAEESCGKCFPCQIGTLRQHEIVTRLAAGRTLPGDSERLRELGAAMADASLCGLGQTAAFAVLSALDLWPELFA